MRRALQWLTGMAVAAALLGSAAAQSLQQPKAVKGNPPAAKPPPPGKATPQRQQALQREQRELQAELSKLKRQLATSEVSRSEATDALASSDIAISGVNRRLHDLAMVRARLEQQVAVLAVRERDVAGRQGERQQQLDQLLRQQQRLALRDPLHLLLEGDDPNRPIREAVYLGYVGRDVEASVTALQVRRLELAALQEQSAEKSAELAQIAEDETRSRQLLEREQAQRKRTLGRLGKEIAAQRQSIARLQRDEQRLGTLIDQISKVLAEQTRKEAERTRRLAEREAAAQRSAATSSSSRTPLTVPSSGLSSANLPSSAGNFAQQRGKLLLPVQGSVTSRFGSPRRGDSGSAGPTWKGVFVRAPVGAEVRSVGDGQIVFADWLRGFGNLLVIDHGDGYLSIYGNNDALLRNVGDRVAVGEIVASVGNTGGSETPGLYFELRFQGRPFDPLGWVAAR